MAPATNSGLQVSWTSIVSTLALIVVVAGGGWTLFQSQLASVREANSLERSGLEKLLDALRADLQRREVEIKEQIRTINSELLSRRQEFPTQHELKAFEKRVDQYMQQPYLIRGEFEVWRTEQGRAMDQMLRRIEKLEQK